MRMFIPSVFIILFCISICRSQDTLFATITDTAEIPLLEIGGILGQPTGLDFQWWFTQRSAVHGILGYSFMRMEDFMQVQTTFIISVFFGSPEECCQFILVLEVL